jgi:xanthine dehydrogenase accessory factor
MENILSNKLLMDEVGKVFSMQQSRITKIPFGQNENITAFAELMKPPVEIIIAGAGNDAIPLVDMAAILGWHATIADGRKTHANAQRFANAKKIIVAKPVEVMQQINIHEESIFLLMSHNYNYDMDMLRQLIKKECLYVGVLGPKKKLEKMLDELQEEGVIITERDKEKIFGPTGLDIGAETAEEIALSIVAEIKAVLAKRDGAALRAREGFIHEHNPALNAPHFINKPSTIHQE